MGTAPDRLPPAGELTVMRKDKCKFYGL